MKSGEYIEWRQDDTLESVSREFKIPRDKIISANKGKNIFSPGEWVFIPSQSGIIGQKTYYVHNAQALIQNGRFLWPVPASKRVSSGYGKRWGKLHEGIDIPARTGSHILAAESGVVVYVGSGLGGYGNITVLGHDNGYFTVYAHAHKTFTKRGQKISRGQVIATVGSTGRSTGPHLHFEIRKNGVPKNPEKYIKGLRTKALG